jgi:hypothetical protein
VATKVSGTEASTNDVSNAGDAREDAGVLVEAFPNDLEDLRKLVEPYHCWAKCNTVFGKRQKQSLWATVAGFLQESRTLCIGIEHKYISVGYLLTLARQDSGDPFDIIDYFQHLARCWDFGGLAEEYFDR